MNISDTYDELRAVWQHYDAIHRNHEQSRNAHMAVEQQVNDVRRALSEKLRGDIANNPALKVQFSNAELRAAEVERQLTESIPQLLQEEATLRQRKQEDWAELERSQEAVKTMRALAALVDAERRMETVLTDVAAMPRMVRR